MSDEQIGPDREQTEVSTSSKDLADIILAEAMVPAASTIANLSQVAESESVKLAAAKAVIDYNLKGFTSKGDVWDTLSKKLTKK